MLAKFKHDSFLILIARHSQSTIRYLIFTTTNKKSVILNRLSLFKQEN